MVYAVTYTTAALVRKRLLAIDSSLIDADITEKINMAEGIIDSVMRKTGRGTGADFTFNADKHGLIRDVCTSISAFLCLTFDVSEFASSSFAGLTADLLWAESDRGLAILSDARTIRYLENS